MDVKKQVIKKREDAKQITAGVCSLSPLASYEKSAYFQNTPGLTQSTLYISGRIFPPTLHVLLPPLFKWWLLMNEDADGRN